jgi:hypothetical protein
MSGSRTPVLGINVDGLGFLTDVSSSELKAALQHLWSGEFVLDSRALIEASARLGDRAIHTLALNDFVVSRGIVSRLIELEVNVDGETLTTYRCDGLIVSSPQVPLLIRFRPAELSQSFRRGIHTDADLSAYLVEPLGHCPLGFAHRRESRQRTARDRFER